MNIDSSTQVFLGNTEIVEIRKGNVSIWQKGSTLPPPAPDYFYIENEYAGTNIVTLSTTKKGTPTAGTYTTSIQYSKDKSNWTTYTNLTQGYVLSINLNQGEKVYFRNDNGVFNNYTSGSVYKYTAFTATYSHSVGGNINSLLDYRNIDTVTFSSGCFYRLFYEDYSLVDSHSLILPATTLSKRCYSNLFTRCTSMTTTVSELPGTTLAENCYDGMYYSCSSLTTAPDLKATTLVTSCYSGMFANCTLLSSIKVYANDNSATSCTNNWLLNVAGSGTFNNLGSATYTVDSASGIPTGWTEVKPDYLYIENTYAGTNTVSIGTSRSGTPSSSYYSTTVEYSKDKVNWNTLTLAAGTLENPFTITLNAGEKLYFRNDNGKFNYYDNGNWLTRIFASESNVVGGNIMTLLNYKNISGTALIPGCFAYLFRNNNTMTSASNLILPSSIINWCYNYSFSNCTALTSPPVLPATTTADNCYSYMFEGDSSLTKTPVLLATTVESNAYKRMFRNCSSLNEVTTYANSYTYNGTQEWLSGVSSTGTLYNNGTATYQIGTSGKPTNWTLSTSNRFVFTNTVITNVGNDKAELTSDIQVNYTGTWDEGYFEVYNELDKDRSVYFSPSDISNGVLTASNLISESNVNTLVSPATVTISNNGTVVWTGSVSFTVVTQ